MESGMAAGGILRPHVEKLNGKYNLGLYVSAADARALGDAEFELQHAIYQQLQHHSREGVRRLQSIVDRFDHKVREREAKWANATPPMAASTEDQSALQLLLLDVLEEPPREGSRRPRGGPRTKRAVGSHGEQPRRHRGRKKKDDSDNGQMPEENPPRWLYQDFQKLSDAAERVKTRARGTQDDSSFATQEPVVWDDSFWARDVAPSSGPASETSSAMYSAVESLGTTPYNSQIKPEDDAYSPEAVEHPKLRRALSIESFGISEDGEQALAESFGLYESSNQRPPPELPPPDLLPPGSPTETNYSSIPDLQDLRISDNDGLNDHEYEDRDGYEVFDHGTLARPNDASVPDFQGRLDSVFPSTPLWLERAPFPIVWEMTRIAMHCGVDLNDVHWTEPLNWESQDQFRNALSQHPCFAGKPFPESASQLAWKKAMNIQPPETPDAQKRVSHYLTDLSYNMSASGPLYFLKLRPLAIGLPHRLGRHFGCDRFLEVTMPSHDSGYGCVPPILRNHDAAVNQVNSWLTRQRHAFLGRRWASFFIKDSDIKKAPKAKGDGPAAVSTPSTPNLKKVYLFAEEGFDILPRSAQQDGANGKSPAMKRQAMLDWLLQFNKHPQNRRQPFLKLFSRIALGLSTTTPTLVFEPHQLRHRETDLLSPSGKVMNDGIGRMSLSVVRKLRSALELADLPTAVQGRLGCAKGMWILDTEDDGIEDWIETYPSQRKWLCDFADKDHRTLEICKIASEVRSASLNSQFITVLEAQAPDKIRLRRDLGNMLRGHIRRDLEVQRKALEHPMLLAAWLHEMIDGQKGRVLEGQVPFLAGLPDSDTETIAFLLSGGFDPRRQTFLWDMVYKLQKARLETLKDKLNMPVGRSTYLFMAVDFLGVLEEGEVQVCFSTKFQAEEEPMMGNDGDNGWFSDTLLVNRDVLVARSPAHYTSDIQKVRAVYRPELGSVKDVIFFSSKGNSPLAEMLSGGDYDGDMAWVCWDPRLVNNFTNAAEPSKLDLIEAGYMRQNKTTLQGLVEEGGGSGGRTVVPSAAVDEMIERSFAFNMPRGLLGRLTKYKEDLCYLRDSVGDVTAVILSTLLSLLVDRNKQGIDFTDADFSLLRRECLQGARGRRGPPPDKLPMPAYQGSNWDAAARAKGHILDHLKFEVIRPVVASELRALANEAERGGGQAERGCSWDPDLAEPARAFEALTEQSDECFVLFEALKADLRTLFERSSFYSSRQLGVAGGDGDDGGVGGFRDRVLQSYEEWCAILPRYPDFSALERDRDPLATPQKARASPVKGTPAARGTPMRGTPARSTPIKRRMASLAERYAEAGAAGAAGTAGRAGDRTIGELLRQGYLVDTESSQWARLRASQAYRMYWTKNYKTLWRLAGRQLQMIKGLMSGGSDFGGGSERSGGLSGAKVVMTPLAYAAMRPNKKIIQKIAARSDGTGVEGVDFDGPGDVDDA